MRRKLIFAAVFLAGLARLAPAQTPDLVLNPGSSYVDAGRSIPWGSSFNRAYVLVPNSPNASVCLYVVNNNPTNAHPFTVTVFQTGDSQVPNYSGNTGRFNPALSINLPTTVAAASMASGFIQSTAAAKLALVFSGSGALGGSPDTADVFIVQTTAGTCGSSSAAQFVQGPTSVGAALTLNPFPVAGVSVGTSIVRAITAEAAGSDGSFNLQVARNSSSPGSDFGGTSVMANGALAVDLYGTDPSGNFNHSVAANNGAGFQHSLSSGLQSSPTNLFVHNSGFQSAFSTAIVSAGTTTVFLNVPSGKTAGGLFQGTNLACEFSLIASGGTGTAPTLDVFIVDSDDNVNFDDRVHFNQVTTTASQQKAGIFALAHLAATAYSAHALAAGSSTDGPIKGLIRADLVTGGTTPNYSSVTITATCY
jgi:hypothetical protein